MIFLVKYVQACCCSTCNTTSIVCPTTDKLKLTMYYPLWKACISLYFGGFLLGVSKHIGCNILIIINGHSMRPSPCQSCGRTPKHRLGWPENQSGFTTKGKQSANNTKWKKYMVKKTPTLHSSPTRTVQCIFAHMHCFIFVSLFLLRFFFF